MALTTNLTPGTKQKCKYTNSALQFGGFAKRIESVDFFLELVVGVLAANLHRRCEGVVVDGERVQANMNPFDDLKAKEREHGIVF